MTIKINLNESAYVFNGDPNTPLLWVIRDEAKLKGTKYGCGIAQCGACTVHIDGQPARACVIPIQAVAGQKVTTIEGVAENHPVKIAWEQQQVPQCGYCQSGQIMSAVALVESKTELSDHNVDTAMAGNICRCGTYGRIRQAIKSTQETT